MILTVYFRTGVCLIEMVRPSFVNFQVPLIIIVHPEPLHHQLLPLLTTATRHHENQTQHCLRLPVVPV